MALMLGLLTGLLMLVGMTVPVSHAQSEPAVDTPPAEPPLVVVPDVSRKGRTRFLSTVQLPAELTFAGRTVPLEHWQVRERVEYEFYQFLNDEGQSIILAKRTGRCFPPIERQLAEAGLPDDLKYFLLLETKCTVAAPAKPTGVRSRRGRKHQARMAPGEWRDERRNLDLVTQRAIQRLAALHADLKDWLLVMAAYGSSDVHVRQVLREQKVDDYWKLYDRREAMRLVPRVMAAKEIYGNPKKYLGLEPADLYIPLQTKIATIEVREASRHLAAIAEELGSYYLELKLLNPEITGNALPRGIHRLKVPSTQAAE